MTEPDLHVVAGLGAVGRAIAEELAARGLHARAIARHRASSLPVEVDVVEADLADPPSARRALAGAAVVYHAAAAPYDRWPALLPQLMTGILEGAAATGARVVYADNLYAYGPVAGPLTEDLPYRATRTNGRVRAALAERLMTAQATGRVRAVIGRASDYYGPWGRQSTAGERLFLPALAGKPAQVLGDPDQPHVHLPCRLRPRARDARHRRASDRWDLARSECRDAHDTTVRDPGLRGGGSSTEAARVAPTLLAGLALFSPMLRAVREQQHQRLAPWVVDHTKFERAFGASVTPHRDAIRATLDWFASGT